MCSLTSLNAVWSAPPARGGYERRPLRRRRRRQLVWSGSARQPLSRLVVETRPPRGRRDAKARFRPPPGTNQAVATRPRAFARGRLALWFTHGSDEHIPRPTSRKRGVIVATTRMGDDRVRGTSAPVRGRGVDETKAAFKT